MAKQGKDEPPFPAGESASSLDDLTPVLYEELRRMAVRFFRDENQRHTLQPTALVHEVYLRLAAQQTVQWANREHVLAVASNAMRRVLVDHARRRTADKRGGGEPALPLELIPEQGSTWDVDFLALDEALDRLEQDDPIKRQVVELRFFGGLTVEETAHELGISPRSVKRHWSVARAWLFREIYGEGVGGR